jgi:ADP-ribosylation factor family
MLSLVERGGCVLKQLTALPRRATQELQMAGINFKAFDLGGHEIARRVWKDYYAKVGGYFVPGSVLHPTVKPSSRVRGWARCTRDASVESSQIASS